VKRQKQKTLCRICKQYRYLHEGKEKHCPDLIERPFIFKKTTTFNNAIFEPMDEFEAIEYYLNRLRCLR